MITLWTQLNQNLAKWLLIPQDVFLLLLRFWIAWAFLAAGILKLQSWDTTLMLFEYEYSVPLLPPTLAAVLGTLGEIAVPPLVILGLITRPAALALLLVNIVAAISYPDISDAGMKDHYLWGLGLVVLMLFGAGRISVDTLLTRFAQRSE